MFLFEFLTSGYHYQKRIVKTWVCHVPFVFIPNFVTLKFYCCTFFSSLHTVSRTRHAQSLNDAHCVGTAPLLDLTGQSCTV